MGAMDAPTETGHERISLVSSPEMGTAWYRVTGRIERRTASALRAYPFGHTRDAAGGAIDVRIKWPYAEKLQTLARLLQAERPDTRPEGKPVRVDNMSTYLMDSDARAERGTPGIEIRRRPSQDQYAKGEEVLIYQEISGRKGEYRWVPAGMVHPDPGVRPRSW